MVLDPITAFGLAANVFQVIDFGRKLMSDGFELHRNQTLASHTQLQSHARCLQQFSDVLGEALMLELEDGSRATAMNDRSGILMKAEKCKVPAHVAVESLLRLAVKDCHQYATDLLGVISKLRPSKQHAKWQSFRMAISNVFGSAELEAADEKLFKAQQNVTLFLILYTQFESSKITSLHESTFAKEKSIWQAVQDSTAELSDKVDALCIAFKKSDHLNLDSFALKSQDANEQLFESVGNNVGQLLPMFARGRFLKSLRFARINERHQTIIKAHERTLKWVLQHDSHEGAPWNNFPTWLESDEHSCNVYWVTGKPGSGKSTLMRYLVDSDTTKSLLAQWSKPRAVRVLSCFFWNPGNEMQRSMEGLLKTLLLQALADDEFDDATIQVLCPQAWRLCMYDAKFEKEWPLLELFELFRAVTEHITQSSHLVLFIDGLDEFGSSRSDREVLVALLLEVREKPNVKMCLSSRPWTEFTDAFEHFPKLRTEELTHQDMTDFVEAELGRYRAMQEFAKVAVDEVSRLLREIVSKAGGVFLWLHLVVRRLRSAAQNGKPLRKLADMLDEIPPDLDDFFKDMLRRIPEQDRAQASKIFQVALGTPSTKLPTFVAMSFADEDDEDFALLEDLRKETEGHIRSRVIAFRRRLDSQCMDLLISGLKINTPGCPWEDAHLEWLHRTARDFLQSDLPHQTLLRYSNGPIHAARYLCNASLAEMVFCGKFRGSWPLSGRSEQEFLYGLTRQFFFFLQQLDPATRRAAKPLFESSVDQLDLLLQHDPELTIVASGERVPVDNAKDFFLLYMALRINITHKYIGMAAVMGLDFFQAYLEDSPDAAFQKNVLEAVLGQYGMSKVVCNVNNALAVLNMRRGFENIESAARAIHIYHTRIRLGVRKAEGDFGKVTKCLIEQTTGLYVPGDRKQQLQKRTSEQILTIYNEPTRGNLFEVLNKTCATWSSKLPETRSKRKSVSSKVKSMFTTKSASVS